MTSRQWHFFLLLLGRLFSTLRWLLLLVLSAADDANRRLFGGLSPRDGTERTKKETETDKEWEWERERESVGAAVIFGVTHWNWEIIAQVLSIIRLIRLRWWADRFASVGASTRAEGFRPNIRELMFVIRWNSMRSFKWFGWLGWMNWIRSNYQANITMIHSYPIQLDLKSSIWPCFKQRHCPTV